MKRLMFSLALLLLFSGCIQMKTDEECQSITQEEIETQTAWGYAPTGVDEHYVAKARITCWHNAALAHAAMNNRINATIACNNILEVTPAPVDSSTLEREHVFCIDAIAKRLRDQSICEYIDEDGYAFEKTRCIANSEVEEQLCVLTTFALLALPIPLFFLRRKDD
jgi:hypothetical protein